MSKWLPCIQLAFAFSFLDYDMVRLVLRLILVCRVKKECTKKAASKLHNIPSMLKSVFLATMLVAISTTVGTAAPRKVDLLGCWEHKEELKPGGKLLSYFQFCLGRNGDENISVFEPTGEGANTGGTWRLSRGKVHFSDNWAGDQTCEVISTTPQLVLGGKDCKWTRHPWESSCIAKEISRGSFEDEYCPKSLPRSPSENAPCGTGDADDVLAVGKTLDGEHRSKGNPGLVANFDSSQKVSFRIEAERYCKEHPNATILEQARGAYNAMWRAVNR